MMRSLPALAAVLLVPLAAAAAGEEDVLLGFGAAGQSAQRELERRFDASIDPVEMTGWLKRLSAGPNQVGAPHNRENAEFTASLFREWGFEARIETFQVLYPTPTQLTLELLSPVAHSVDLREPPVPGDASSEQTQDVLPPFTAYSADGDVTGELIYVNYGMPDDYRLLQSRGISVKGKIVIARYGNGWRGLKPKLAHQHGAIGAILYSDPENDGYATGDIYPTGSARPPKGAQRGSVQDLPVRGGDPLTPNVGATAKARRLSRQQAETLPAIPVLPIGYGDAQILLANLGGPVAPPSWRGGLGLTYHIGGGPAKVRLVVRSEWTQKPIHNVIATLRGAEFPDQWVLRGNHRDAWVFGAGDPMSGHVAMMAEAKAMGGLARAGWKPRRTLVYCSWDGEEPGLLGSTEFVEEHADELRSKAVLYLNSDSNQRGFVRTLGSAVLQRAVNQAAAGVTDPQTGVSARDRLRARLRVSAYESGGPETPAGDLPLAPAGSGSDYTPFLQHLGIPIAEISYGGEGDQGGAYHSAYDTFERYMRFNDPGLVYGAALAQTSGRFMLRAVQADLLPYQFAAFANSIERYVGELRGAVEEQRKRAQRLSDLLKGDAWRVAGDPKETQVPPQPEAPAPYLEFAALDNALARLKEAAGAFDRASAAALGGQSVPDAGRVNALLLGLEQTLIDPSGLPGRPWYRHLIYAPGIETGYAAKTLPGVREAIEGRRWEEANREIATAARALDAYAARLQAAAALFAVKGSTR